LAHFSDASPPPTPSGTSRSRDENARFSINSRDRENERDENDENDENDDDAIREPGTFTDAAAEDQNALVFAGPFAEPAADDTRLQFQLRALETPFGLAYLGIIDILTQYGAAKIAENLCFGALACGADISCQPPDVYARRFKRFIDAHVLKVAPTIDASAIDTASATLETDAAGDDGTNERV
jgi:1-phosphatidylinositol-4-phosphate 5-kinase